MCLCLSFTGDREHLHPLVSHLSLGTSLIALVHHFPCYALIVSFVMLGVLQEEHGAKTKSQLAAERQVLVTLIGIAIGELLGSLLWHAQAGMN